MLSDIAIIVFDVATALSTPTQYIEYTGYDHGWKEPCVGKDFKGIRL